MAKGDTKTNQYLDIAANGTRADLPTDTCCETRSQTLIREVAERIMDVEDEVEEIKNNPDVVDIVPTYAALQNYDTSGLTDKDIIRVLADETHDGDSTYYRYNAQSSTWTYVGESKQYEDFVGTDGTTGGQNGLVPAPVATDAGKFLNANGSWEEVQAGGVTELTTADYNWPVNNPTSVASWLLEPGTYCKNDANIVVRYGTTSASGASESLVTFIVGKNNTVAHTLVYRAASSGSMFLKSVVTDVASGAVLREFNLNEVNNTLTSTSVEQPLSAAQGKTLKDFIGDLTNLTTTDKTNLVAAINEAAGGGGGPTVVQTTGTSTTDVMSQNAVTDMIYPNNNTTRIRIGAGSTVSSTQPSIAIGQQAIANKQFSIAIGCNNQGDGPQATSSRTIAIGHNATASATTSVALGSEAVASGVGAIAIEGSATALCSIALGGGSSATMQGEMNIGVNPSWNQGYNNSAYRLLTGLYDPQNAHDAATKGYVDATTDSSAPTTATVGRLGQIYIDTSTATAYMCVEADDVTPSYTWKQITA